MTPISFGVHDPSLRTRLEAQVGGVIYNQTGKPLSSAELSKLLRGVDGLIAGLDTIDRHAIESGDRLKVIARYGVGLDNVDLNAAREHGVIVTYTPGANAVSVAELALALILALARNLVPAAEATRRGEWPRLQGLTLQEKTVGILGLGAIGKQLALRLLGFDCQIPAYDPAADREFATQHSLSLCETMQEVIASADFLSLHLPLIPETRGLVNADFLARMKRGACLINTPRGEIIDEGALYHAIKSGHLRGAALDAFIQEPPPADNPLLYLPQVIATPHMGAHTDGATNNMAIFAMEDCLAVLRGETPKYRVV